MFKSWYSPRLCYFHFFLLAVHLIEGRELHKAQFSIHTGFYPLYGKTSALTVHVYTYKLQTTLCWYKRSPEGFGSSNVVCLRHKLWPSISWQMMWKLHFKVCTIMKTLMNYSYIHFKCCWSLQHMNIHGQSMGPVYMLWTSVFHQYQVCANYWIHPLTMQSMHGSFVLPLFHVLWLNFSTGHKTAVCQCFVEWIHMWQLTCTSSAL